MRFDDSRLVSPMGLLMRTLMLVCAIGVAACSKSPIAPEPPPRSLLGTWTGNVRGDLTGTGSATLVLAIQIETPNGTLVSGTWSFVFPNPIFGGTGTTSGLLNADTLNLLFSRPTAPCPGEPGDVAQRTATASLVVTGNRMHGDFGVLGCPRGVVDLQR